MRLKSPKNERRNLKNNCIYPGTFDPITNGHVDVVARGLKFFDKIIVAIARNSAKNPMFSFDERILMTRNSLEKFGSRVEIIGFTELLIDFAKTHQISTVIRGLRAVSDFEYELQIGYANAALWAEFETVYLMPTLKNAFISSSIVRGIFGHGGDVTHLVPPQVTQFLREEYEYKF